MDQNQVPYKERKLTPREKQDPEIRAKHPDWSEVDPIDSISPKEVHPEDIPRPTKKRLQPQEPRTERPQ